MRVSIRNQLAGTVVSATRGAAMAVVKVQLTDTDAMLTSSITIDGADELGIEEARMPHCSSSPPTSRSGWSNPPGSPTPLGGRASAGQSDRRSLDRS